MKARLGWALKKFAQLDEVPRKTPPWERGSVLPDSRDAYECISIFKQADNEEVAHGMFKPNENCATGRCPRQVRVAVTWSSQSKGRSPLSESLRLHPRKWRGDAQPGGSARHPGVLSS
jgi:hypothetical protein